MSNPNADASIRFQDGAGPRPIYPPMKLAAETREFESHTQVEVRTAFQAGPAPCRFRFQFDRVGVTGFEPALL